MDMLGTIRTMVVLATVAALAPRAGAFSMGEVTATTGVQSTLAQSGTTHAAGTIGAVKNALNAATSTKEGQLAGAAGGTGWGGKAGTQTAWASLKSGSSAWASPASSGWNANGGTAPGTWATASNAGSGAWASGSWGTNVAH
jgi:hypothetical protein